MAGITLSLHPQGRFEELASPRVSLEMKDDAHQKQSIWIGVIFSHPVCQFTDHRGANELTVGTKEGFREFSQLGNLRVDKQGSLELMDGRVKPLNHNEAKCEPQMPLSAIWCRVDSTPVGGPCFGPFLLPQSLIASGLQIQTFQPGGRG